MPYSKFNLGMSKKWPAFLLLFYSSYMVQQVSNLFFLQHEYKLTFTEGLLLTNTY